MIETRPGIREVVRIADRIEPRHELVCLDKNERVGVFPPEVFAEMLAGLTPQDLSGYPVIEPFTEEFAGWLGASPPWLQLTSGSDAAIRAVFEVYVRSGDVLVAPQPTFAMYNVYARLSGATLRGLEYGNQLELPVESVTAALTDGPRMLCLPNPNSPTGTAFSLAELRHILSAAREQNVLVLIDEAYYWFTPITAVPLVAEFDNLVVTRTFSKAAGLAGVRLGCLVSQPQNIDVLRRVKPMYEINGVALRLGQYLIRHDHLIWEYAQAANAGRDYLERALTELGLQPFTSHANFVVARVPAGTDIASIVAGVRAQGFLIKGAFPGTPLADCIRVSTARVPVLREFMTALLAVWSPRRAAVA